MTIAAIAKRRIFCKKSHAKIMKTALFISPHLDDVIFSCGGTFARLADENWRTILCTIFTKSVVNPKGFALACQLDKDLAAGVDYMKLRRAEDRRAAKIVNAAEVLHLDFLEAPHRGYESAPELFAKIKTGDEVWQTVGEQLDRLDAVHQPTLVFAPQGLGNHVDHLQTIRAALNVFSLEKIFWYRDTPYAIRQPDAAAADLLPDSLIETFCDIENYLPRKINACAAYESQIDFQFGGAGEMETQLKHFHRTHSSAVTEDYLSASDETAKYFEIPI